MVDFSRAEVVVVFLNMLPWPKIVLLYNLKLTKIKNLRNSCTFVGENKHSYIMYQNIVIILTGIQSVFKMSETLNGQREKAP